MDNEAQQKTAEEKKSINQILNELLTCRREIDSVRGSKKDPSGYSCEERNILDDTIKWFRYLNHHTSHQIKVKNSLTRDKIFSELERVLTNKEEIRDLVSRELDSEIQIHADKKDIGIHKRVTPEGRVRVNYYGYNALCDDFFTILGTVGYLSKEPELIKKSLELRGEFDVFERRHLFQDTYLRYIHYGGPKNSLERIAHLTSIDKITGTPCLRELRRGKFVRNAFDLVSFRNVVSVSNFYEEAEKKIAEVDRNLPTPFKNKKIEPTREDIEAIVAQKHTKRSNKSRVSKIMRDILFETNEEDHYIDKEHLLNLITGRSFPRTSYQSYRTIIDHVLSFEPESLEELSKVKSVLHNVYSNFRDNQFEILTRSKEILSCDEVVREIYFVYNEYFKSRYQESQIEHLGSIQNFMHELFMDYAYSKDCVPKVKKDIKRLFEDYHLSPKETFNLIEKTKQVYPSLKIKELINRWAPHLKIGEHSRKNIIKEELDGIIRFKDKAHGKRTFSRTYNFLDIVDRSIDFIDREGHSPYLEKLRVRDYILENFQDSLNGHYLTKIFEEVYLNETFNSSNQGNVLKAITHINEKGTNEIYDFRDKDSLDKFFLSLKGQVKLYDLIEDYEDYENLEKEFISMTMKKRVRLDGSIIDFDELKVIEKKDYWAISFFRNLILKDDISTGHWENLTYLINNGFLKKYLKSHNKFGEINLSKLERSISLFIETSRTMYNKLTYLEEKESLDESKDQKFIKWVDTLVKEETLDDMISKVRFVPSSISQMRGKQSIISFDYRKLLEKTSAILSRQSFNFQEVNSFVQNCHFPNISYGTVKIPQTIACLNSKQENEDLLKTLTYLQSTIYRQGYFEELLESTITRARRFEETDLSKDEVSSREIYELFQSFENPDFAYSIFNSLIYRKAQEDISEEFKGLNCLVSESLQRVKESHEKGLFETVSWTEKSDKLLEMVQRYNIFGYHQKIRSDFEEIDESIDTSKMNAYQRRIYSMFEEGASEQEVSRKFQISIQQAKAFLGHYKRKKELNIQPKEYYESLIVDFFHKTILPVLDENKNNTVQELFEATKQVYELIDSRYKIKSKTDFVELVGRVSNSSQTDKEKTNLRKTTGLKFSDCPQYLYDDPVTSRKARVIVMPAGSIHNTKVSKIREKYRDEISRARQLFKLLKPQRVTYERRSYDGELDIDLYIEAMLDLKNGNIPDTNVFTNRRINQRDVSLLLTIDQSKFLMKPFRTKKGKLARPLMYVQPALVYALDSMAELEDKFAILGYSSRTAEEVMIKIIKDFDEEPSEEVNNRIGMLAPIAYSRTGSVYKYFADTFSTMPGRRKIHIDVVTRLAEDTDYKGDAAIKDTAEAAQRERAFGIELYGICLDQEISSEQLEQVYGQGRFLKLEDYSDLPSSILDLYRVIALS